MRFPYLQPARQQHTLSQTFAGYNHTLKHKDGEWWDTKNVSARNYPLLSPRLPRGIGAAITTPYAIGGNKDGLAYVAGSTLYYKGEAVEGLTLSTAEGMTDKRIISFGAYLIITPDMQYYNTVDAADYGAIGNEFESASAVSYTQARLDGTAMPLDIPVQAAPPIEPVHGDYWIDNSDILHELMQYSSLSGVWVSIPSVYTKIATTGIEAGFKAGDAVEISGAEAASGASVTVTSQINHLNGTKLIQAVETGYIIVIGLLDQAVSQGAAKIKIGRKVPDLDHVCVCQNRLWGCKYGDADGMTVNEIYASKLGDFRNFNVFQGLSTDSYAASVGQGGPWTGCANHMGYPIFFKEDHIYKIFGSQPKNFQINDSAGMGVQIGCDKSIQVVNGSLVYKARDSIVAYDGAFPMDIGYPLGEVKYTSARAGAVDRKYYISMKDNQTTPAWHLFVFDANTRLWMREDNTQAIGFQQYSGDLYYIDATTKKLVSVFGSAGTKESTVEWAAETGVMGYEYANRKYISRMNIRVKMGANATIKVFIKYDSKDDWIDMGQRAGSNMTDTFLLPIRPKRCDHFSLKLTGQGDAAIYSIDKILEIGGDGVGNIQSSNT